MSLAEHFTAAALSGLCSRASDNHPPEAIAARAVAIGEATARSFDMRGITPEMRGANFRAVSLGEDDEHKIRAWISEIVEDLATKP